MTTARRGCAAAALLMVVVVGGTTWCASAGAHTASTTPTARRSSAHSIRSARLVAPKTTPVQDARYLTDVAKADPDLAAYVQQQGNLALRAMLTDGTAFCAFLRRGGGIDNALVAVAIGARGVESETHLPATVTTFNTLEAVALVDLCPNEQKLVPASVRTKIRRLNNDLGPSSA